MRLTDQFRTGWRNLRRQKLRTTLTIFAIVIGAVSVTVMLSLVTSAKSFLVTSAEKTGMDRRVIVTGSKGLDYRESTWAWADGTGTRIDEAVLEKVSKVGNVNSATLYTSLNVLAGWRIGDYAGEFKNTHAEAYTPNGTIKHILLAGDELTEGTNGKGVLITSGIAKDAGYKGREAELVGKEVTFSYRDDYGPEARKPDFVATIVGVAMGSDGDAFSFDLDWAVKMDRFEFEQNGPNGTKEKRVESQIERGGYSSIWVDAKDKNSVDAVLNDVKSLGFGAAAGKEEIDNQATVFTIIGLVLGGIGGIALLVAAIGVINTMVMATLERTREIGIMRAIGATKKTVRRLFTVEAGVLGFMGGVFGVVLAFAFSIGLNQILNKQLADSGITDRDIVQVSPAVAVAVLAITTVIGMIAGRLPARRAANMDPVEALRYE